MSRFFFGMKFWNIVEEKVSSIFVFFVGWTFKIKYQPRMQLSMQKLINQNYTQSAHKRQVLRDHFLLKKAVSLFWFLFFKAQFNKCLFAPTYFLSAKVFPQPYGKTNLLFSFVAISFLAFHFKILFLIETYDRELIW